MFCSPLKSRGSDTTLTYVDTEFDTMVCESCLPMEKVMCLEEGVTGMGNSYTGDLVATLRVECLVSQEDNWVVPKDIAFQKILVAQTQGDTIPMNGSVQRTSACLNVLQMVDCNSKDHAGQKANKPQNCLIKDQGTSFCEKFVSEKVLTLKECKKELSIQDQKGVTLSIHYQNP